jgi:hypothetical protein
VRLGSTAEFFSALVLPRIGATDLAVVASFGDDAELLENSNGASSTSPS